ncbi:MAG: PASTA domain-containing protein [Endomicrobium sp.]|jgi:serine/threonine-protein kinase|nr:PASTA domain-containing protein [Endomicrobium sp.]
MFKNLIKLFIGILIIFFATYVAFNNIMKVLVHNKKEVVTPNIIGKNLYEALDIISIKKLGLRKEYEELNQNIQSGIILQQNPRAGMLIREGRIIKIIMNNNSDMVYVPNLIGQTLQNVDVILKRSFLVMGSVFKKFSLNTKKGLIIAQSIMTGSKINKGSTIDITVSNGIPDEPIILMPNFVNKNLKEAKIWALKYGINFNLNEEENKNIETNTIVNQYPEPDTDITETKLVNFDVAVETIKSN